MSERLAHSKFRCKYSYENHYGHPVHTWSAVGAWAGIHLHISDHGVKHAERYGDRYSGGIEIHYRFPPDYMRDEPPSHDRCWLLEAPCWHDGSSLQAVEIWIPAWVQSQHDHEGMFDMLCRDLHDRMQGLSIPPFGQLVSEIAG